MRMATGASARKKKYFTVFLGQGSKSARRGNPQNPPHPQNPYSLCLWGRSNAPPVYGHTADVDRRSLGPERFCAPRSTLTEYLEPGTPGERSVIVPF